MDCTLEKECSALGGLFQSIVNDLKISHPIWDDFAQKATKLHIQLKSVISALNIFLDALQKIADMATAAKGATRDIGTALTRICMRHRSIENRLKTLTGALIDCLVEPLTSKIDDWHKTALAMDRDHAKAYKKSRHEIKKRAADAARLQKKLRRGQGQVGCQRMLDSVSNEIGDRYLGLLDAERAAVRQAMIEQRSQYCLFVSWFKPIMDGETSLLGEISQMTDVVDLLYKQSADPYTLPAASEQFIRDVKGLDYAGAGSGVGTAPWRYQTPPGSPDGGKSCQSSSLGSRKSSFCSLSSADSQSAGGAGSGTGPGAVGATSSASYSSKQPIADQVGVPVQVTVVDRRVQPVGGGGPRYSSMSSHDSGFTSQDTLFKRRLNSPIRSNFVQPARFDSDDEAEHSAPGSGAVDSDSSNDQSTTPSPSLTSVTWPTVGVVDAAVGDAATSAAVPPPPRPHTISTAAAPPKRQPLGRMTFVPPLRSNKAFTPISADSGLGESINSASRIAGGDVAIADAALAAPPRCPPPPPPQRAGGRTAAAAVLNFNETRRIDVSNQTIYVNAAVLRQAAAQYSMPTAIHRPSSFGGGAGEPLDGFASAVAPTPSAAAFKNGAVASASALPDGKFNARLTLSRDDDEDTLTGDCNDQLDALTADLDRYWSDCARVFDYRRKSDVIAGDVITHARRQDDVMSNCNSKNSPTGKRLPLNAELSALFDRHVTCDFTAPSSIQSASGVVGARPNGHGIRDVIAPCGDQSASSVQNCHVTRDSIIASGNQSASSVQNCHVTCDSIAQLPSRVVKRHVTPDLIPTDGVQSPSCVSKTPVRCALQSYPSYCTLPRSVVVVKKSIIDVGGDVTLSDNRVDSTDSLQSFPPPPPPFEATFDLTANQNAAFSNSSNSNTIVRRPAHLPTNHSRAPPPPIRRNSTITASTPSAPAVDFVRSGSRCATPDSMYNDKESVCSEPHSNPAHQQQQQQSYCSRNVPLVPSYSATTQGGAGQVCDLRLTQNRCPSRLRQSDCRNRSLPRI